MSAAYRDVAYPQLKSAQGLWGELSHRRQREAELIADIVSYTWRTSRLLVTPTLAHKIAYHEDTTVHLK